MRIERVSVTGLFGCFDHDIPLNLDDRITIIHGPNGFGKTMLLRMLNGLLNQSYSVFLTIPFNTFTVYFDNRTQINIQRKIVTEQGRDVLTIYASSKKPTNKPHALLERIYSREVDASDAEDSTLERIRPREYRELLRVLAAENTMAPSKADVQFWLRQFKGPSETPEWLQEIQQTANVRFIQTERLLSEPSGGSESRHSAAPRGLTVIEYSKNLTKTIGDALANAALFSYSLASSFPMRLLTRLSERTIPDVSAAELRQQFEELEQRRSQLAEAGLLGEDRTTTQMPEPTADDLTLNVLSIYANDERQKLQQLDDLRAKVEILRKIINQRFLYKSLSVSKQDGFVFTTSDGKKLTISALSSGEQHEVVLLYELLFCVQENTLVLIDEPEISLHMAWQQDFLHDLLDITRLLRFDVLIATHSPDIIHDRWDLTVGLTDPEENL